MVVRDDLAGGTHLIPADAGELLLALQAGQTVQPNAPSSADALHDRLAVLERTGLIRRETPAA
jgi:hypothetical protein